MTPHTLLDTQPILRAFQALTVVAPTLFYTATRIVASFASTPTSSARGGKLLKAQLSLTLCAAACSLAEAAIDIKKSDPSEISDPDAVYALFLTLVYVILSIGLVDATAPTSYPHHGAWGILLICQGTVFALSTHETLVGDKLLFARSMLQAVQLGAVIFLLAFGLSVRYLQQKNGAETDEETRPLLGNGSPTDESTKSKDAKEPDEDEVDRQRIRNRPFWQYVASFKIFLPYMYPKSGKLRAYFVGMCIVNALTRVATVALPLTLGAVVNGLGETVPWTAITAYVLLKFFMSQAGLPLIEMWLSSRLSTDLTVALQRFCYGHIMNLSANFHDGKKSSVIWQIMHQGQDVIDLLYNLLFSFLPQMIDLLSAIAVLTYLFGLYMTFIVATTAVLFYWITFKAVIAKRSLRRSWVDAYHEQYYQMSESTSNWSTVSYFDRIPYEIGKYREKGDHTRKQILVWWVLEFWTRGLRNVVPCATFAAACAVAALQIAHHQLKVGDFVILITYWSGLTGPLALIANELSRLVEKLVNAEKLVVVLEKTPRVQDATDARPFMFLEGAVQFENVAFAYDGKRQVTKGLTFRAAPGKTIALVGQTGGGKSTILKLLFRFYDVDQGRILIDGQDIRHVEMNSFRKHIATVPQNPVVFNMSIMENVRYPDVDCTDEEAVEACKAVELHDKIMTFTKGYQEKVGERGTKLSGGELQRLAIARAILKKADILLLDEATSSVDSITEKKIQRSIRQLCAGKTAFVVAHRLSTILHADHILVIRDGQIVEGGAHEALIKQDGAYNELWRSQLRLQADERSRSRSRASAKAITQVLINDMSSSGEDTQELVKSVSRSTKEGKELKHTRGASSESSSIYENDRRSHDVSHASTETRGRMLPKRIAEALGRRMSRSKSPKKDATSQSVLNPDAQTFRLSRSQSPKKDGSAESVLNPEVLTFRPRQFQDGHNSESFSEEESRNQNGLVASPSKRAGKENAINESPVKNVVEVSDSVTEPRPSAVFPLKRGWSAHGREVLESDGAETISGEERGKQFGSAAQSEQRENEKGGIE